MIFLSEHMITYLKMVSIPTTGNSQGCSKLEVGDSLLIIEPINKGKTCT